MVVSCSGGGDDRREGNCGALVTAMAKERATTVHRKISAA
jgi:hypothetical protein